MLVLDVRNAVEEAHCELLLDAVDNRFHPPKNAFGFFYLVFKSASLNLEKGIV